MAKAKKGKLTLEDVLVPVKEQPYGILTKSGMYTWSCSNFPLQSSR